jgi:hypothetical protein
MSRVRKESFICCCLLHDCMISGKRKKINSHIQSFYRTHISPTGNLLVVVHTCTSNDISFIGSGGSWNLFGGGTAEWIHNMMLLYCLSERERESVCVYMSTALLRIRLSVITIATIIVFFDFERWWWLLLVFCCAVHER